MRDTSDMMEDAMSEDTMMDCEGDGAVSDLSDLTTDISDSSETLRVAAERLLNLLGVDEEDEDFLSSEDEGVELDIDDDEIFSSEENNRLLQQLANSLAEELKTHRQSSSPSSSSSSSSSATRKYQSYHPEDLELDYRSHKRLKVDNIQNSSYITPGPACSWNAGWDACAAEAVRYLMEEEGLAGHHPTVLALKNHLALQRNLTAYKT